MALRRILAITRKSLGQLQHDRRTLGIMLVMPLVLIIIFGYGFGGTPTHIHVSVVNLDQGSLAAKMLSDLPSGTLDLSYVSTISSANATVQDGTAWGAILFPANFSASVLQGHGTLRVYLDGTSPSIANAILGALQSAMIKAFSSTNAQAPLQLEAGYLYGSPGLSNVDALAPGVMAFATLFVTTILSLIVLVRERQGGVLERLFATPLRPSEFVAGHALAMTLVALVQSMVILVSTVVIFQVTFVGNLGGALALLVLVAIGNLGLGMLLSAAARNELQAVQFIPLVIFPQIFFSGALFPIESIPLAARPVSEFLPLTYAAEALRDILLRGWGFGQILLPLAVLGAWAVLMIGGAMVLVRRQA